MPLKQTLPFTQSVFLFCFVEPAIVYLAETNAYLTRCLSGLEMSTIPAEWLPACACDSRLAQDAVMTVSYNIEATWNAFP